MPRAAVQFASVPTRSADGIIIHRPTS